MLMKNNNLIAVHGKINSGKDTVGNIIQILTALPHLTDTGVESFLGREIDSPYQIKKFADKLKDMVCLLIGCSREQLEDREFKEKELGEEWWCYKGETKLISYNEATEIQQRKLPLIKHTPRLLLQLLGTDAGRDIIHPNIWVNALMSEYRFNFEATKVEEWGKNLAVNWIITDLRFSNEFEAVKERGGITIKVHRDLYKGNADIAPIPHESETALDNETRWDYVIDNNSTIEDLIKKVREILNKENII